MTDSLSLITAQISLLEPQLAIVHIPIRLYSLYLQPLLRLLFEDDWGEGLESTPWTNRHEFLNISVTPVEVSVVCRSELAEKLIFPVEKTLRQLIGAHTNHSTADIVKESYIAIQVDGQGVDAGQRVLELTGPLAMAGIPIFFITTYFCDYVLVPAHAKRTVTLALEQRGFIFSPTADAFVSQLSPTLQRSPQDIDYLSAKNHAWNTSDFVTSSASIPSTPPAKDIDELQLRTFRKLKNFNIMPSSNKDLRLVFCAGSGESSGDMNTQLKEDLLQVLLSTTTCLRESQTSLESKDKEQNLCAQFLSITITANEPVSILVEERLLPRLGKSLFGAKEEADVLIPVFLDLHHLGFETTGIVGGVAGKLSRNSKVLNSGDEGDVSPTHDKSNKMEPLEMTFLSSAKSGAVMIKASQLDEALGVLKDGYTSIE